MGAGSVTNTAFGQTETFVGCQPVRGYLYPMDSQNNKQQQLLSPAAPQRRTGKPDPAGSVCPVCGAELIQEKCKVVCRSPMCVYRIIYNCSEF